MRFYLAVAFAVQLLCATSSGELSKIQLDENGNFIDPKKGIALFHGFNAVQKSAPWYPEYMLNRTQLKLQKQWGMNVVRLGVMWSGVMPIKNKINESYLQKIEDIIDACADYGIYVLLDMHQDVLSSKLGTYDGLPTWFVDEVCTVSGYFKYPWPFGRPPKQWFENYLTYASMECAERLYSNSSGAWLYWGDFWETVAKRYAHKSNVIGYELLNEPPPANVYRNIKHILPGYVGKHLLLPVYDYLVKRIRQVDQETLIFYEPMTYSVFVRDSTGFSRVPGSTRSQNETQKSVLSYHYYCWLLQTKNPSLGMSFIENIFCEDYLLPATFSNSHQSIQKTGGGRFLTEFGLCGPDGNPKSINTIECSNVMEHADKFYQSWAYWDGNFIDSEGNPIKTQVQAFSRMYPMYTKGRNNKFNFDWTTGVFTYQFEMEHKANASNLILAEIFFPSNVHYSKGADIAVTPDNLKYEIENNILLIRNPEAVDGQNYKVNISIKRLETITFFHS